MATVAGIETLTGATALGAPPARAKAAIVVEGVSKAYGATQALREVSMTVTVGATHALVGRNGAGKSTLVGVLTGLVQPDAGRVLIAGADGNSARSPAAQANGVACVYQHPQTLPHLTVAENLALGAHQGRIVRWRERRRKAAEFLEDWNIPVGPDDLAGTLDVEQRQLLEIARALSRGTEIVLLDEPTAQLDRRASQRLFSTIKQLQGRGVTFLFISHHLDEIFDICETATVLRDGAVVSTRPTNQLTTTSLVDLMVGGVRGATPQPALRADPTTAPAGESPPTVLELVDVAGEGYAGARLHVGAGEVVALTGLSRSGKTELAEGIVGLRPRTGTVTVGGTPVPQQRVTSAQRAGIGFVPEDRHLDGFVAGMSIEENVTVPILRDLSTCGWIRRKARREVVADLTRSLDVVPADNSLPVAALSGGNQQKVVMARALANRPTCLVLMSPTAGVDIASKAVLYRSIRAAADRGTAVLLVSDEVDEVAIADRAYVMFDGSLTHHFTAPWDLHALVDAIEGVRPPEEATLPHNSGRHKP